jgi:hypothetical protein
MVWGKRKPSLKTNTFKSLPVLCHNSFYVFSVVPIELLRQFLIFISITNELVNHSGRATHHLSF